MTADLLRRAATKARELADGATPGPWAVTSTTAGLTGVLSTSDLAPTVYSTHVGAMRSDDMRYIATMHPGVALAVADWLDTAGADLWAHGPLCDCGSGCHECDDSLWQPHVRRALAVARAILNEPEA